MNDGCQDTEREHLCFDFVLQIIECALLANSVIDNKKKSGIYSRDFDLVGRVHPKEMMQYASLKWVIGSGNGQHG